MIFIGKAVSQPPQHRNASCKRLKIVEKERTGNRISGRGMMKLQLPRLEALDMMAGCRGTGDFVAFGISASALQIDEQQRCPLRCLVSRQRMLFIGGALMLIGRGQIQSVYLLDHSNTVIKFIGHCSQSAQGMKLE